MRSSQALFAVGFAFLALCACSSGDTSEATGSGGAGASSGSGAGGAGGGDPPLGCTQPSSIPCEDQVVLGMNLQPDPAPGLVTSEPDGDGFRSFIDATAGGIGAPKPDSYVYARFTDAGLEKVDISDEASLTSMDWDIAFRRFVVRINSGNSGPSCVAAARVAGTADYDGLTALPAELKFFRDEYFTPESCDLINDTSGMEGSPGTALSSYYRYRGCLGMSGNIYIIALADSRTLKFTVTHYYKDPQAQELCNAERAEEIDLPTAEGANFQVRWAFLE